LVILYLTSFMVSCINSRKSFYLDLWILRKRLEC
jgi:hypothetical protein